MIGCAFVWLLLVALVAVGYKFVVDPYIDTQATKEELIVQYSELADQAAQRGIMADKVPEDADTDQLSAMLDALKQRMTSSKGATSTAKQQVRVAIDSFSGYAVLRSDAFKRKLSVRGIDLKLLDDGADYRKRLEALKNGDVQMAVITIDALIKTGHGLGSNPATIVMVIDETVGADAMVAWKKSVPNIDALNTADTRIVATPDSPSETLARVVMSNFQLPQLPTDGFINADGAEDVYKRFQADRDGKRAYVLWEPFVSKALEEPDAHVLMDSSRFRGYIVDVLVVQRDFLLSNESAVDSLVEAYLRTLYESGVSGMSRLVSDDASATGQPVSDKQAKTLTDKIWWKNTSENYAHFGIVKESGSSSAVQHLDRMIGNIVNVLQRTGAISSDPTNGNPGSIYYDAVLRRLHSANFHPAIVANAGEEKIRSEIKLPKLSEQQWAKLVAVGELQVDRLVFSRGTARLTNQSKLTLESLVNTLRSWPQYYLAVTGRARQEGDADANRALAEQRAATAVKYLVDNGIVPHRIRATAAEPSPAGGQAQSVSFRLVQQPF